MTRLRLDQALVARGLVASRSQAHNLIKLGKVLVAGSVVDKAGLLVSNDDSISLTDNETYVSRAGLKLASVVPKLGIDFRDKVVLDVGSSTGGFTDYALKHGAAHVIAVDVGTDQMHPSLRDDPRIELHEKTDIRDFISAMLADIVVMDVSFISLRHILPILPALIKPHAQIIAMVKPQFESTARDLNSSGIVKNDTVRRRILRDFEIFAKRKYLIKSYADSEVAGLHGNKERFYVLISLQS